MKIKAHSKSIIEHCFGNRFATLTFPQLLLLAQHSCARWHSNGRSAAPSMFDAKTWAETSDIGKNPLAGSQLITEGYNR